MPVCIWILIGITTELQPDGRDPRRHQAQFIWTKTLFKNIPNQWPFILYPKTSSQQNSSHSTFKITLIVRKHFLSSPDLQVSSLGPSSVLWSTTAPILFPHWQSQTLKTILPPAMISSGSTSPFPSNDSPVPWSLYHLNCPLLFVLLFICVLKMKYPELNTSKAWPGQSMVELLSFCLETLLSWMHPKIACTTILPHFCSH